MPEGSALPREQEMAQQYGVGRASGTRSLRLLEPIARSRRTGTTPGKGAGSRVGPPYGTTLVSNMTVALQMQGTTLGPFRTW